jgi:hypothetical protein
MKKSSLESVRQIRRQKENINEMNMKEIGHEVINSLCLTSDNRRYLHKTFILFLITWHVIITAFFQELSYLSFVSG